MFDDDDRVPLSSCFISFATSDGWSPVVGSSSTYSVSPSLRALELGGKLDALGPPPDRSGLPQSDVEILQRVGADDGVLPAILVNMLVPSGREQEGIGA
jgi:hypothetical protein